MSATDSHAAATSVAIAFTKMDQMGIFGLMTLGQVHSQQFRSYNPILKYHMYLKYAYILYERQGPNTFTIPVQAGPGR